MKLDIYDYPDGHEFTVVPCEYCGTYYEPGGKEHKCKKKPKYEVKDVVCDYGIYENGELKLILNSYGSALKILKILEFDDNLKNEARPCKDTNFDKITESVESLAELLCNTEFCPYANNDEVWCDNSCISNKRCMKEWLQREAEQ